MIDENYHIEDIDDIFDSQDKTVKEAATKTGPVKATIIFEDSISSKSKVEEPKSEDFQAYEEAYDQEGSEGTSEKRKPLINNVKKKTLTEKLEAILAAYKDKPNTVVATIVGIIIAILFLWIGFLKTLVICLVVLIANIIGQLFDQNPFVVGVFETIVRKFK